MSNPCIICHKANQDKFTLNGLPLIRCANCGLIRREVFDISIVHYETLDAVDTPEKRKARFRNSIDRIKLFSRFVPRVGWCDVGTGEGIFLEVLSSSGGQGVGIEPSEESCKKAASHGVKIVGRTIEDIGIVTKMSKVRTISLFHVIEHVERPDYEIRRIYEALSPGGFLIIETPNIDSFVFRLRNYKDPLIYPEHFWYFSKKNLQTLLKQSGFCIIASGRRDFDQYNLPIRESLFRLGLSRQNPLQKPSLSIKQGQSLSGTLSGGGESYESIIHKLVRRILSRLVIITGRLQYVWVVVQK